MYSSASSIGGKVDAKFDLVRQEYKRYKQKKPLPDYSEVIDFSSQVNGSLSKGISLVSDITCCGSEKEVGLKCANSWKVYYVSQCPGLIFITNPFTTAGQHHWMYQSLTKYTQWPYPSNIDIHLERNNEKSIWETSKIERSKSGFKESDTSIGRLRWVHLGYHFDYNVVDYKSERYFGFPEDLKALMKCLAACLGFTSYNPETAIINYYPTGSSMGGHTDHYEEELDQPLISVSLGQPAIFLIGSEKRTTKPIAMWLRSGDIVIMSGKSRLAYHAVPAIIKLDKSPFFATSQFDDDILEQDSCSTGESSCCASNTGNKLYRTENTLQAALMSDSEEQRLFSNYMSNTRININVRQVHRNPTE